MSELCNVDETLLYDPTNDERRPLDYYINGVAFLANWLESHRLDASPLFSELLRLCQHFEREPAEREKGFDVEIANSAVLYGSVGAAASWLRGRENAQMRTELERFATDAQALPGNFYLFYIAGLLAGRGWTIDFVRESQIPREPMCGTSWSAHFHRSECPAANGASR